LLLDHGCDFRMRMTDQHRARAEEKIDVLVAAYIPDAAGLPPCNHHLVRHVAEGARRQHAPGGVHEFAFGFAGLGVRRGERAPECSVSRSGPRLVTGCDRIATERQCREATALTRFPLRRCERRLAVTGPASSAAQRAAGWEDRMNIRHAIGGALV